MSQSKFVSDLPSGELGSTWAAPAKSAGPKPTQRFRDPKDDPRIRWDAIMADCSKYDSPEYQDIALEECEYERDSDREEFERLYPSHPRPWLVQEKAKASIQPATRNGNGAEMAANASQSSSSFDIWAWIKSIFGA